MVRILEVTCPICHANPGEQCRNEDGTPGRFIHEGRVPLNPIFKQELASEEGSPYDAPREGVYSAP